MSCVSLAEQVAGLKVTLACCNDETIERIAAEIQIMVHKRIIARDGQSYLSGLLEEYEATKSK